MTSEFKTVLNEGDSIVLRDPGLLTVTIERCGAGYAVVAKSPATGAVFFSEFIPNEAIG